MTRIAISKVKELHTTSTYRLCKAIKIIQEKVQKEVLKVNNF